MLQVRSHMNAPTVRSASLTLDPTVHTSAARNASAWSPSTDEYATETMANLAHPQTPQPHHPEALPLLIFDTNWKMGEHLSHRSSRVSWTSNQSQWTLMNIDC